jgi:S-DNA-T family DNA segregation ATPase FtsK/SpoIIIE
MPLDQNFPRAENYRTSMAQTSISVSQLKCAVLDPAWRKAYVAGKNPPTMSFAPAGQLQVFGREFHAVADKIVAWLVKEPLVAWDSMTRDSDTLWQFVHDTFVCDFLELKAEEGKVEEAMAFAQRMQSFCERLVFLRKRAKNFSSWQDVFVANEYSASPVNLRTDKFEISLTGRVDVVRFDDRHNLEIVDYKLTQGSNQMQDMVQLAIYGRMLELGKPGCQFAGVVEYYLPEFQQVLIKRSDLDRMFEDLVTPVLVELFGRPPQGPSEKSISYASSSASTAKDDVAGRIVSAYAHFKLPVEVVSITDAPQLFRFNLKPGPGVKVNSLANRAEDLQVALSLAEPPLVKASKGFVVLDLPKPNPEIVPLEKFLRGADFAAMDSKVSFPVGLTVEGKPLIVDLANPNTCHGLIAGTSGSGKSELLKAIVASLIANNDPKSLRLAIVDPKILTFTGVTGSPFLAQPVITDVHAAIALLKSAVDEMDQRYLRLAADGQTSLKERWDAGTKDIPYFVLIFDEFADLILSDRNSKKDFEELVVRIAAKGRAAGIHLLLATQRPDRNIVTGLIKANLPLKICLRVTSGTNSQIVLDETGAESLLGRGDLLCDSGKGIQRAQSYFIPQTAFLKLCQNGSSR